MNLREMAEKICAGGGAVSKFVSRPDGSGNCRTVWGEMITQAQYYTLLRLCRPKEQSSAMRAHDRAVDLHS